MRISSLTALVASTLVLSACVNTEYVGESYAPTDRVDVFYSMDDVVRPHTVMGKITATAMDGWDSDSMVDELRTQAMAKGADALVIEGVHTDKTGSHTYTYGTDGGPTWIVTEDGKLEHVGSRTTSSSSITTDTKEKVMDAELIKYRESAPDSATVQSSR